MNKKIVYVIGGLSFTFYYLLGTTSGENTYKYITGKDVNSVRDIASSLVKETTGINLKSLSPKNNSNKNDEDNKLSKEIVDEIKMPIWGETNFIRSKKVLQQITLENNAKDLYCNCDIKKKGNTLVPDFGNCGFNYRKNENRANRLEAEHIVPISWYGKNLQCWQKGGRKNCEKASEIFNLAEADLVNLQYTIGEFNGDRSSYRYGQWKRDYNQYGSCKAKVDFENRQFEPREEIRGWLGRVHLYMQQKYGLQISSSQLKLMEAWSKQKPTDWECKYNNILKEKYGSEAGNPFTTAVCE